MDKTPYVQRQSNRTGSEDSFHGHPHDNRGYGHKHSSSGKNILVAFALNFVFTIIEVAGGILTNSVSILSDAVHDCGDSLSLGLAWYFDRIARKKPDYKYTFGYKRFALLGAFINITILLAGSVFVVFESVGRLLHPQNVHAEGMLWLAIAGIIVNGAAVLKTRKGKGLNEKSVSLHLLEDVLGWAAVLIASIIMLVVDFPIIDPILSLLISIFILFNVYRNFMSAIKVVLQGTPENIEFNKIKSLIESIDGVYEVHDLHIWSLDSEYNVASMHIVTQTPEYEQQCRIKGEIKLKLHDEGIPHVTIEFELPSEKCERCC